MSDPRLLAVGHSVAGVVLLREQVRRPELQQPWWQRRAWVQQLRRGELLAQQASAWLPERHEWLVWLARASELPVHLRWQVSRQALRRGQPCQQVLLLLPVLTLPALRQA